MLILAYSVKRVTLSRSPRRYGGIASRTIQTKTCPRSQFSERDEDLPHMREIVNFLLTAPVWFAMRELNLGGFFIPAPAAPEARLIYFHVSIVVVLLRGGLPWLRKVLARINVGHALIILMNLLTHVNHEKKRKTS